MSEQGSSRRHFIMSAAVAASTFSVAACGTTTSRTVGSNRRLRIAQIGCGGKGFVDLMACGKDHDIVALCDVDDLQAANARAEKPNATFYHDYRDLFDREKLDAVIVSTPDHSHALPALIAMQLGYHVYVQKPLTHTIEEARLLHAAAKRSRVITSMGNQGTSLDGFRSAAEVVRSGGIGTISEVHVWTNRPIWPQGIVKPRHIDPIPASLHWDLWLGGAPERSFAAANDTFSGYTPFSWRGFWDFGTGALGDMACHVANLPFFALELSAPDWVEASAEGNNDETAPTKSTIRFGFPKNRTRGPVVLTWYDGGRLPPADLLPGVQIAQGGFLLKGSSGTLYSPTDYGESFELYPRKQFQGYTAPKPFLPRSPGIYQEWLLGILNNQQPMASFDYSAPLTEAILLGNVALRTGQRIEWDAANMRAKNCPAAEAFIKKTYRRGFELPRG
jgi:predicted dehydrogenase